MDIGTATTIAACLGTGLGGYVGGKMAGKSTLSQVASDTVGMLEAQVQVLQTDKEAKDVELTDLRSRVRALEGLVTQRAEVAELSDKVSLVKDTVDRIADRIGA
jgi:hypothetical protein